MSRQTATQSLNRRHKKTYFSPKMISNRHIMWPNAFFTDLRLQLTITRQSNSCQMTFTVQRLPSSKNFTRCRRKCFRFFTVGKAEQRQWKWLSLIYSFDMENGKFRYKSSSQFSQHLNEVSVHFEFIYECRNIRLNSQPLPQPHQLALTFHLLYNLLICATANCIREP